MPVNPKEAPPGYMAFASTSCHDCALAHQGDKCREAHCTPAGREDGQSVIFLRFLEPKNRE